MMTRIVTVAVVACALCGFAADFRIETDTFTLTVGDDAKAKSLVVKATGEECLDAREGIPLFATTQVRPFRNETKLIYPNRRTTYPANRIRREGDRLVVGFEIAPTRLSCA